MAALLMTQTHARAYTHTQDSMIKRERSPSFPFCFPFLIFSLVASVPFPENAASNQKKQLEGKKDPLDGHPLFFALSLSLPSHLSVLGFRIDIIPFRSNQWTIISHALKAGFSMHQISRDPFAHTLKKEEEKKS
jgi:hypothetical protein